jgi:hypothetical protein
VAKKQISPKLKFQVVLEILTGEKSPGQPVLDGQSRDRQAVRHPPQLDWGVEEAVPGTGLGGLCPGRHGAAIPWPGHRAGERRLAELEQLLGKKEVEPAPRPLAEIALLKNFLGRSG